MSFRKTETIFDYILIFYFIVFVELVFFAFFLYFCHLILSLLFYYYKRLSAFVGRGGGPLGGCILSLHSSIMGTGGAT